MHSCPCLSSHALCNNYFHVPSQYVSGSALSQGSSYHTSYAPVVWVSHWSVWHLRTRCLNLVINSFSKLKLCHWQLLFFPLQSSQKIKNSSKRKGREGKGRRRPHLPHSRTATATKYSFSPPCSLHSSWRLSRLELRRTQHSSSTDQGKTLTFSDIQCSPYSPASRFVLHLIQYAQFQLFSLKYQTLQRQKKIPLSPAAVTQQAETIHSLWTRRRLQFSSQIQRSMCYFLCFNQFRMWKAVGGREGERRGGRQGSPARPGQPWHRALLHIPARSAGSSWSVVWIIYITLFSTSVLANLPHS